MMTISDSTSIEASVKFSVITLFPEMFDAVTKQGVVSRAVKQSLIEVETINPREFTTDKHRTVDDRPYGGGPGMLMKVEPLEKAIFKAKSTKNTKVIYLSPQGNKLNHSKALELSRESHLVLLAGRYEGIDERLMQKHVDEEISIGDFILSGGEIAAMALIDSVSRLVPGVLGHTGSAEQDSFADGLLDHPHYTRPELYEGESVPEVLLSGNHQKIEEWRLQQRLGRTWLKRPDLLEKKDLTQKEQELLEAFQQSFNC